MTEYMTRLMPSLDIVVDFYRANFEAMVEAQTALVRGAQEISKEMVAQAQAHLETAAVTGKSAMSAKSIQDVVGLNVDGAKASYERFVSGSTKLGEMGVQVANEAFAPIKARAVAAAETLRDRAAA